MKTKHGARTGVALALLVLTVVTCGGLHADEAKVVKAIRKLGSDIICDDNLPRKPIIDVALAGTGVTDTGLKALATLKLLRELWLMDTKVTER